MKDQRSKYRALAISSVGFNIEGFNAVAKARFVSQETLGDGHGEPEAQRHHRGQRFRRVGFAALESINLVAPAKVMWVITLFCNTRDRAVYHWRQCELLA